MKQYADLKLAAQELRQDMISTLVTVPRDTLNRFIDNAIQREKELEQERDAAIAAKEAAERKIAKLKDQRERLRAELEAPNHWQKRVEGALALLKETDE